MWLPPLLLVPLIVYNIFGLGLLGLPGAGWAEPVFSIGMVSGAAWSLSIGDLLLLVALVLLFAEVLRATRTGVVSIVDHGLSAVVFVVYLVEFLVVPSAATSLFFICLAMSFIDVVAGFAVSIRTAQRDVSLNGLS